MSSKQEGGRKISGEEKNLANKQAELFGLQTNQISQLQAVLQQLQPQQYQILGFDPVTGMPLQKGQLPTAPTAPTLSAPGNRPVEYRSVFSGKNWGKNDDRAQQQSLAAIKEWEGRNTAYQQAQQQYNQQKAAYDQQIAQIQKAPEQFYLPDMAGQRAQENNLLDQILGGQLSPEAAQAQGQLGGVAAGRAGFMGEFLRWLNNNPNAQAAQGALGGYQNELSTGGAEAPALQQLLGQYNNQLAGNIPEASQMADFLAAVTRGVNGTGAVNPMVERQLQQQEQERRTRLFQQLGAGYETSSAGIEALNTMASMRAGTIDQLNQTDLMNAVSGYASLLGGAQNRQAQTANQYLGLSNNQQSRQAQLLNQYLGLNEDTRLNVAGNLAGYTGLTNFSEGQRAQEYQNEWARRTGLAGAQSSIATAPYSSIDYTGLINAYTGALGAATQRQTGPVSQGGLGGAIGGLAGTALGGGLGFALGGAPGAMVGAQLGGGLGGSAGGAVGGGSYQPPPLYNFIQPKQQTGGSGGGMQMGSFYTRPYFG